MKPTTQQVRDSLEVTFALVGQPLRVRFSDYGNDNWAVSMFFKDQRHARRATSLLQRLGEPLQHCLIYGRPDEHVFKKGAWVFSVGYWDYRG